MQEDLFGSPNTLPTLPACHFILYHYILNPPLGEEKKKAITHPSYILKKNPPMIPYPSHIQWWKDFSKAERDIILESPFLLGSQVFYK